MNILFCGDIVGRPGRDIVLEEISRLRRVLELDLVVANGENAAGGFGITPSICEELHEAGIDIITTGNHIWDQREIIPYIARDNRLLRPVNYPATAPGGGAAIHVTQRGERALVVNVMTRLFMDPLDDPFAALDRVLADHELGSDIACILVDVHGETSSEKQAIAHYLDGRVSLVVGSHTHVPTSDTQVLDGGTAFQTDAGMCGDYNSVIGSDKTLWVSKFRSKMPVGRIGSAKGAGTLCGIFAELDAHTGLARRAEPVVVGGRLRRQEPRAAR